MAHPQKQLNRVEAVAEGRGWKTVVCQSAAALYVTPEEGYQAIVEERRATCQPRGNCFGICNIMQAMLRAW